MTIKLPAGLYLRFYVFFPKQEHLRSFHVFLVEELELELLFLRFPSLQLKRS